MYQLSLQLNPTLRRRLRRTYLRILIFFRKNFQSREERVKYPKKVTEEEARALRIWGMIVHAADSELLYNPSVGEAYAEWVGEGGPVYLFLESGNLRIVNTVVGYDVRLSPDGESWAKSVFTREVHKRRTWFKEHALGKVNHSLDILEGRIAQGLAERRGRV